MDEESLVSEEEDAVPVDLTVDEWFAQGNEENLEDTPPEIAPEDDEELNILNVDLDAKVSVERIDVFSEGESVKPLDEEAKDVLKRLKEVFASKAKETVPSLKCRNRLEVEKQ